MTLPQIDETKIQELAGVRGTELPGGKERGWIHIAEFSDCVGVQIRSEVVGLTSDQARRLAGQLCRMADRFDRRQAPDSST